MAGEKMAGEALPTFAEADPERVEMLEVEHDDGRMSQYPPASKWDDWVEWDAKAWPRKVARNYTLVPTVCFNCESACGLLAYVDKKTYEIKRFEGNPAHPAAAGATAPRVRRRITRYTIRSASSTRSSASVSAERASGSG